MSEQTTSLGVSEFKAHALQILDQVSRTGEAVVITKRGKPLVRVIPYVDEGCLGTMGALADSVTSMGDLVSPLGEEDWDACR